ncbi:cytochrome P450 2K1-like [Anguilla anguilla]|uniref:cytochrome P450 2K1-like n=1 Tax=Anguilla anguilla TaxID=7936 RepID=UPI0015A97555|nr:cytochrome P450 2K1-like [Anguilla anguilla]XP_035250981.1 cytochrome P450 2K1-like [Anguilla anguilla]
MVVLELVAQIPLPLMLFGVASLLYVLYLFSSTPGCAKFPPGPRPLPLLGNLLHLDLTRFNICTHELSKKYGSVFTVHLGPKKVVIVTGYKAVKQVLLSPSEFQEKDMLVIFREMFHGQGVLFANGKSWKAMKHFCLGSLRNFGMGKAAGEEVIIKECNHFIEVLEKFKGEPFDVELLDASVSNIICTILFGDRFDDADPTLREMLAYLKQTIDLISSAEMLLHSVFPWLSWCGGLLLRNRSEALKNYRFCTEKMKVLVGQFKDTFSPQDCRGIVDDFLLQQLKESDQPSSYFSNSNLLGIVSDLFVAGTETTYISLVWGLILMAKYPDIQDRVQEELSQVIGHREPRLKDQKNLPYTNAVIHEIQRFGSPVSMITRTTSFDVTFQGYLIEKGTKTLLSLESVLRDEDEWETPHSFNPGHFLDEKGCFTRRDALLNFSVGHRACPGESLAKMELFLFFTFLLQRFRFSPPPGVSQDALDLNPVACFVKKPSTHRLCARTSA